MQPSIVLLFEDCLAVSKVAHCIEKVFKGGGMLWYGYTIGLLIWDAIKHCRRSSKIKPTNISEWKAILENKIAKLLKFFNCKNYICIQYLLYGKEDEKTDWALLKRIL